MGQGDQDLAMVVAVVLEDMGMDYMMPIERWEEVVCEIAKGLVGIGIAACDLGKDEAMKYMFAESLAECKPVGPTGWPVVPPLGGTAASLHMCASRAAMAAATVRTSSS